MKFSISNNVFLLAFLYFIQGLPYGFQVQFLPLFLRSKGISLTSVGLFKLLFLPWVCKVLWAPLVDIYGTKRQWLIWSILGLVVTCLIGCCVQPDWLFALCIVVLLLNVFAATQDIAVDGIAVSVLSLEELGHGNIAQVVGYKAGSLFGGGAMMWLVNLIGWTGMFLGLALVYVEAILFIYTSPSLRVIKHPGHKEDGDAYEKQQLYDEENFEEENNSSGDPDQPYMQTSSEQQHEHDEQSKSLENKGAQSDWFISQVVGTPGTFWMLGFVVLYKLGEQGALSMLPLFLLDQQVEPADVHFWTGVVGQILSIVGSVIGGWLVSHSSLGCCDWLRLLSLCRMLPLGIQLTVVTLWSTQMISVTVLWCCAVGSLCSLLVLSGMVTTVTFTFMMQCSQVAPSTCQATHYTTLATAEVLGKVVFMSLCGALVDACGYRMSFFIFTVLIVLVLPYLNRCPENLSVELCDDTDYSKED